MRTSEKAWVRLNPVTESCAAASLFVADLGPEGLELVRHLLYCPGCRGLAPGRAELGPDQQAQRIEGVRVAEGLMAALMVRKPVGRLAFLDAEPGFVTGAFLSLVACAVSDAGAPVQVTEVALWTCEQLDRIRCDRHHPLNRRVRHGAVLDLLKHLEDGGRLPGLLALRREAKPDGPEAQSLLRMEAEAMLWNRQIQALSRRLAECLLPPLPWCHRFLVTGDEVPAAETGIVLGRLARAPHEWMAPLSHVLGCPSCRIQLGGAGPAWCGGGAARPRSGVDGSRWEEAVLPALGQVGEALREELGGSTDLRQGRVLLWALEDLARLVGSAVAPPFPRQEISSANLEPELREAGQHVADCQVCQEEACGIVAMEYRGAEELFAVLESRPWSWEKAAAEDGRAWKPSFGRLLACERARSKWDRPRLSWLRDIEDRRLENLVTGVAAREDGAPAAGMVLRDLLGVRRQLLDMELLRGLCCCLARRLPKFPVELYEIHQDLLRVERRVEWAMVFLLERGGPAVSWTAPHVPFESWVGWVSRAPAAVRGRLAQVTPSAWLREGSWGLGLEIRRQPLGAIEWTELLSAAADHRRALFGLRLVLDRCAMMVPDPWQAELLGYLCRELEEVDRRVADTLLALARQGNSSRRGRRSPGLAGSQRGRHA